MTRPSPRRRKANTAAKSSRANASTPPDSTGTHPLVALHLALPDSPEKRAYMFLLKAKVATLANRAAVAGTPFNQHDVIQKGLGIYDCMSGAFLSEADYRYWMAQPAWSIDEAVCLVHGYPPDLARIIDIKTQGIPLSLTPPKGQDGTVKRDYDATVRAIHAGELLCSERMGGVYVRPETYLRWYVAARPATRQHDPDHIHKSRAILAGPLCRVIKTLGLPDPRKPQNGNGAGNGKPASCSPAQDDPLVYRKEHKAQRLLEEHRGRPSGASHPLSVRADQWVSRAYKDGDLRDPMPLSEMLQWVLRQDHLSDDFE